jgi:hypothetical protein
MRAEFSPPRAPPQGDVRKPALTSARRWVDSARISAVKIKPPDQPPDEEPPRRFERSIARFTRQKAPVED